MPEDLFAPADPSDDRFAPLGDPAVSGDDEYEEISSDEVDRIVTSLEDLAESTDSENIRFHLEEAMNRIFYLVYEDDEEIEGDAQTEAA